jgi:phosphotransferase system, enzyme I, PtsP
MQQGQTVLVLRRLLAQIRDVMAGEGNAQTKLARIVSVIAADLVAEVCSVYVRRAGDVLELFATQGLRATAVRRTRLRIGEGLIGEIAANGRPLALADAQSHPNFAYRPETGEETFQSLMGVPILRSGQSVGVLAVQNVRRRQYTDEEVEALQTVAMVLAELVIGGNLVDRNELAATDGYALHPLRLEGVRLNTGLALGVAVLHRPHFTVRKLVAEDTLEEHDRLRRAVAEMHGALDDMLRASDFLAGSEHREVLETYRMIAEDVGWLRRIGEAINTGLTAEAAVQKVNDDTHARMSKVSDPYLRERVHDLEDLANRLLQHLIGDDKTLEISGTKDVILVARNLGPAQLLDYARARLRGVILEEGSPNAHVVIVARALDIPFVGQVRDALNRIDSGEEVILDADHAQVFLRPGDGIKKPFLRNLEARRARKAAYAASKDLPAVTVDGVSVSININAGLLVELSQMAESGADGIGLYRTEVPFMVRSELPDVESQQHLYRKVLEYAAGKPVIFRTLDIGGDKVQANWNQDNEANPAMGWRAIRVSFDRPALLRQQLRALIMAAAGQELSVMFPMIAEVEELDFARRLFDKELDREKRREGALPSGVRVGAMLEVPALLFQLPALLSRVDFVSVGTSDLMQFLFASDRTNYRVSERYDVLSPMVLSLLKSVVQQGREKNVPVNLCGEMASHPLDAMALIGIGFRNISVSPPAVGPIKEIVRSLRLSSLEEFVNSLCTSHQRSVRENLKAYAKDHGIAI